MTEETILHRGRKPTTQRNKTWTRKRRISHVRAFSGHVTKSFKCCVENNLLGDQVKLWYELESYGTYKSAYPRFAADKRALRIRVFNISLPRAIYCRYAMAENDTQFPKNCYSVAVTRKKIQLRRQFETTL